MDTYSLVLSSEQIEQLLESLKEYRCSKTPPYALYQLKMSDATITAYTSNKVVFQGKGADFYAKPYLTNTAAEKRTSAISYPQAGSDEVGTGDYFGPVCVCAAYVDETQIPLLKQLGVADSKQLTDEKIIQIAPVLIKHIPYSLLVLDNYKYNQVHETCNMNAIKAKLHNQAYLHLKEKINHLPALCVVDQFTPESSYYRYLKNEKSVIKELTFETKAENKYLSVACGSIIARFAFLKAFDAMKDKYGMEFPKGAGANVDAFIPQFYQQYGMQGIMNTAKYHFKNSEKIK